MNWTNAFKDSKGDWNLAECLAFPAGAAGVVTSIADFWLHGTHLDLQSYGLGIGAIIAALGAAQRLRGDPELDRQRMKDGNP